MLLVLINHSSSNIAVMFRIVLILTVINLALCAQIQYKKKDQDYCFAQDVNPYKLLSTKTAYEFVHGNWIPHRIPKCTPVQYWKINRHGTRLPGKKQIVLLAELVNLQEEILKNYENEVLNFKNTKSGRLCEQDVDLFKNWYWNHTLLPNIASYLTQEGWRELKLIGLRNKARFSEILTLPYTEKDFLFRYTRSERTNSSFRAFAEGVFGEDAKNIEGESYKKDTLLETYKNCKYWEETVENNPATREEYNKFISSEIYTTLRKEVSDRLSLQRVLNETEIKLMFDMCRYEKAWYIDDQSTWCASFTKQNFKVLEYAEDLMYYYEAGHGITLNAKMGCMPVKDWLTRFEKIVKGDDTEPKGVFYFTHSTSLQSFMTAMEMNKDEIALKHDNMNEQKNRKWRTSLIGPFATNIDIVLHQCTEGDEFRITFYQNEKKYCFEGCPKGICSWEYVKMRFSKTAEECSLDFCKKNKRKG